METYSENNSSSVNNKINNRNNFQNDEKIDPRVENYLDILNCTSNEINILERELDKSRNTFRSLLSKATTQLHASADKLGRCVTISRPYYALAGEASKLQAEIQRQALRFQRSNVDHQVAKAAIATHSSDDTTTTTSIDVTLQDQLNKANDDFIKSEEVSSLMSETHHSMTGRYVQAKTTMNTLYKDEKRNINKAKAYFDLKDRLDYSLEQERQNIADLDRALKLAKQHYKEGLKGLEHISNDIHRQRTLAKNAEDTAELPVRTPGVGAEDSKDIVERYGDLDVTQEATVGEKDLKVVEEVKPEVVVDEEETVDNAIQEQEVEDEEAEPEVGAEGEQTVSDVIAHPLHQGDTDISDDRKNLVRSVSGCSMKPANVSDKFETIALED